VTVVSATNWRPFTADLARGRVVGTLSADEDGEGLRDLLVTVRDRVLRGELKLLSHANLRDSPRPEDERRGKQQAFKRKRVKRYVVAFESKAGPRIIKIAETVGLGNTLMGLAGGSVARREHDNQLRAERLGIAVAGTRGFLEWREGPMLRRALQVQTFLDPSAVTLETFLSNELALYGDVALDPFADALARTHALPFFHADLKGFHAFIADMNRRDGAPATYDLEWIDLGRCSFHMTPRKRVINLYQALRFIVPGREEAEERFVRRYCETSGWHAKSWQKALRRVRRFLAFKLRTHPHP
jgi:hypothetical protein